MSGTSSEKRRLDSTREALREAGQEALRMAARKFGPEERDLDDGDNMAQIQELHEQLKRLRRQLSAADGNSWPLRVRRYHGVRPGSRTRFTRWRPTHPL
jgi:uncharacterized membrane protein YccC